MRILHFSFRQFFILLNLPELERICREAELFPNAAAIRGPSCRGSARSRRRWDWQGGGQKEEYSRFEKNNLEGKQIYNEIGGLM